VRIFVAETDSEPELAFLGNFLCWKERSEKQVKILHRVNKAAKMRTLDLAPYVDRDESYMVAIDACSPFTLMK